MREVDGIREQLRRAMDGGAWHGAAVNEIIADLSGDEAAARPIPSAHTPLEIVLHIAVWMEVAARRIRGVETEPTPEEDWPTAAGADGWPVARVRLARAREEFEAALDGVQDADLGRRVVGHEYDVYHMLHGVVQHTLYHAGQIALLKKATRSQAGPGPAPPDGAGAS